jgi:predicted negative regulator of RcsB-dependent stress response
MLRCQVNNFSVSLDEVLKVGIRKWKSKNLKGLLCRLVLGSVIYNIWQTRNEIKHLGQPCSEEQILKKVLWEVRTKIAGKGKFPKIEGNMDLASK